MKRWVICLCALFLNPVGCIVPDGALDPTTSIDARRVWCGEDLDLLTGDISPDGHYLSDINWDTGKLQLVDLKTGEAQDITARGYDGGGYAWTSAFSNDGQRVAVSWYSYQAKTPELRVISLDGTADRLVVAASPQFSSIDPLDWSTDDDQILVALQHTDRAWSIGMVSMVDRSLRIIKTLSWGAPGGEQSYPKADLSPDGRYVAYDYRPDLEERARHIYALAVDGSRETQLVSGSAANRVLGWIPDGSGLLFYSNRTGRPGIWQIAVRDARPVGEPALVRSDVHGLVPIGFAGNVYAYGITVESRQVRTAVLDTRLGSVSKPPRPIADPPSCVSLAADWSPDGANLAYFTQGPYPDAVETLVRKAEKASIA